MAYYSLPKIKAPTPQVPTRVENNRANRGAQLQQEQAGIDLRREQQLAGMMPVSAFLPQLAPMPMGPMAQLGTQPGRLPGFAQGGSFDSIAPEPKQPEDEDEDDFRPPPSAAELGRYAFAEGSMRPVNASIYGSGTGLEAPFQRPVTQVLAADQAFNKMGLPEPSMLLNGVIPDTDPRWGGSANPTGVASLDPMRGKPEPAVAQHEALHMLDYGLTGPERARLDDIIARNPPPGGTPTAHHPPPGLVEGMGIAPMGPSGLTAYFDYASGRWPEEENVNYLPGGGWAGLTHTGEPILGRTPSAIPLEIQHYLREMMPIVAERRGVGGFDIPGYQRALQEKLYGPGFSRGGAVTTLPGVRRFAEGGDVYSGGNPEEDEDYQRFLAEEARAQEQVMVRAQRQAAIDELKVQVAREKLTQQPQVPAAPEDQSLRIAGTLRENLDQNNRPGYGEILQKAPAAGLNVAANAIPEAINFAGQGLSQVGEMRLPGISTGLPTGGPGGMRPSGGPGVQLGAGPELGEALENKGAWSEAVHPINVAAGEFLAAGGRLEDRLPLGVNAAVNPLGALARSAGYSGEQRGRDFGNYLIPETLGQAALYGASAIGAGGPLEIASGGLPLDDLARMGARGATAGGREAAVRLGSSATFDRLAPRPLLANERRGANLAEELGGDRVYGARIGQDFGPEVGGGRAGERFTAGQPAPGSRLEPLGSILQRVDNPYVSPSYLRSVAAERGIDLGGATTKADIVAALRQAPTPPRPPTEYDYVPPRPALNPAEQAFDAEQLGGPRRPSFHPAEQAFDTAELVPPVQPGPPLLPQYTQPMSQEALNARRPTGTLPMGRGPQLPPEVAGRFRGPAEATAQAQLPEPTLQGLNARARNLPDVMEMGPGPAPLRQPLPDQSDIEGVMTTRRMGSYPVDAQGLPTERRISLSPNPPPAVEDNGARISRLIREAQAGSAKVQLPSERLAPAPPGPRTGVGGVPAGWVAPDPGNLPLNDPEKYQASQVWMANQPANPPVNKLSTNQIQARLYNAGLEAVEPTGINKRTGEARFTQEDSRRVRERYEYANSRGIKMPASEAPSGLPDAFDLARAGKTPEPTGAFTPGVDVRRLSVDDALEQARMLGFRLDEGALRKGTAAAKAQEWSLLQRATDEYNATGKVGVDAVVGTPQDEAFRALAAKNKWVNAADAAMDTQQRGKLAEAEMRRVEATGGAGGTGDPGATAARASGGGSGKQPSPMGFYDRVMDALYVPLSGDIGSALRQDVMRMINPLHFAQNRQVVGYGARAFDSMDEAERAMEELRNLPRIRAIQEGSPKKLKIEEADVTGRDLTNRETSMSDLLTKTPVVGGLYGSTSRANAMIPNARRYLMVEDFLERHPKATLDMAQQYADFVARMTGRGNLDVKFLRDMGPLFTSLRFMASMPQRAGYLVPWPRLVDGKVELFGPIWREAVKEHVGFFGSVAGIMGLAQGAKEAGLPVDVGWDPSRTKVGPRGEPAFGMIKVGNSQLDVTGGVGGYLRAAYMLATGKQNGVDYPRIGQMYDDARFGERYRGTLIEELRNKGGPLPGMTLSMARLFGVDEKLGIEKQVDFLRPEYWDKGQFGFGKYGQVANILDVTASRISPLFLTSLVEGIRENGGLTPGGIATGALGGLFGFFGGGINSFDKEAYQVRAGVLNETFHRDRAKIFAGEANARIGKDENYGDLANGEKAKVIQSHSPQELAKLQQQAIAEGDQLQIALFAQENKRREFDDEFSGLHSRLVRGEIKPYEARQQATAIEQRMYAEIKKIETPKFEKGAQSQIQQLEANYKAIFDKVPKLPDGKPNYAVIEKIQTAFLDDVRKREGSEVSHRLFDAVQPQIDTRNHPLQQFYDKPEMKAALNNYYDQVPRPREGDAKDLQRYYEQQNGFLLENPARNALLYAGGYVTTLRSGQAIEEYKKYAAGKPDISIYAGYTSSPSVSYNNLKAQYPAMALQISQYQGLRDTGKRDDLLRTAPALNVALWRGGLTPMVYTVDAWDQLKR